MSTAAVILLGVGLLTVLAIAGAITARGSGPPRRGSSDLEAREQVFAAQAEVEAHDIDEMIEARNELRARIGKKPIGDELGDQARED